MFLSKTIVAIDENIESEEEKKRRGKSIYTKKSYMVVCGLAKQLMNKFN